ncbi:hypothetical protein FOA52_007026 [Chlamydomonas sp. UWO 241]|nr:hypothetical protein FOA52_007026 [Chlamydomonas sp. UWO 241]
MSGNELITLQLGGYANYVGSHYWNVQDEHLGYTESEEWGDAANVLDHGTLFAISENRAGKLTYRPRALFVDFSGSLGGVKFGAAAAAAAQAAITTWEGSSSVSVAPPVAPSDFTAALLEGAEFDGTEDNATLDAYQV